MDSSYEARAKQALAIAAATNSDALIKKRKANNDVSGPTAEATGMIVRATGTAGPIGASYAISAADWKCKKCRTQNRANATKCIKCRSERPKGAGGAVVDPKLQKDHGWREVLDPKTQQMYYWNTKTQQTQERLF